MTIHIQMLQDIATHARAMADSIDCFMRAWQRRFPSSTAARAQAAQRRH